MTETTVRSLTVLHLRGLRAAGGAPEAWAEELVRQVSGATPDLVVVTGDLSENGRPSELREAVWDALNAHAVTIAFPQIDVHFDEPVARGLAALGRAA